MKRPLGKKSILTSPRSSLAPTLYKGARTTFWIFLDQCKITGTINTWGSPPSLVNPRLKFLPKLRKGWGNNWLVVRESFSQLGVGKFLSKRLPKPCPLTQWVASNSLRLFVKILKSLWEISGRGKELRRTKFLGLVGKRCVNQNFMVEWVSEISKLST